MVLTRNCFKIIQMKFSTVPRNALLDIGRSKPLAETNSKTKGSYIDSKYSLLLFAIA